VSRLCHLLAALAAAGCAVEESAAAPERPVKRDPEPAAAQAPAAPGRFTIIAVGDVMLGGHAESLIRKNGLDYPFSKVKPGIESHAIAFGNLEAPISARGKEKPWKRFSLRVRPSEGRAIARSGIDAVTLANNHMMDFGAAALSDTVKHLDEWGIVHAGAGTDIGQARAPARFDVEGTEVDILAYCAWSPSPMHAGEDRPGVAPLEREVILEDVRAHAGRGAVVIVSLHWGVQHTDRAAAGQVELAREIVEAGASAVIGHHPHRPQEIEVHAGRPIAYSLGNFVFGHMNSLYRDNIALVLEFEGGRLVLASILPVAGHNGATRFQPWFLTGGDASEVIDHVSRLSRRFGTAISGQGDIDLRDGR